MSVGFLTQYYRGLGHSQRIKFIAEKTAEYTDVVIMDQLFRPPIEYSVPHIAFLGDYTLDFNGTQVWNLSDPITPKLLVEWTPSIDLVPGDYSWELNYNGSTWLKPSNVVDQIRIRGRANVTTNLGSEWSQGGDLISPNWISGVARDIVLGTTIIGNNSSISLTLQVPSGLPPSPDGFPAAPTVYDLAFGWIDEQTGEYNLSFVMPSDVPSGVYDLHIDLDF